MFVLVVIVAGFVDADASGIGAFVGASGGAIGLAVTNDGLAGFDGTVAGRAGAFFSGFHIDIIGQN